MAATTSAVVVVALPPDRFRNERRKTKALARRNKPAPSPQKKNSHHAMKGRRGRSKYAERRGWPTAVRTWRRNENEKNESRFSEKDSPGRPGPQLTLALRPRRTRAVVAFRSRSVSFHQQQQRPGSPTRSHVGHGSQEPQGQQGQKQGQEGQGRARRRARSAQGAGRGECRCFLVLCRLV